MGRNTSIRIVFDLLILFALYFMPWWAAFAAALLAVLWFPRFYEILLVGGFIDLVYAPAPTRVPYSFGVLAASLIVYILASLLRDRLALERPSY